MRGKWESWNTWERGEGKRRHGTTGDGKWGMEEKRYEEKKVRPRLRGDVLEDLVMWKGMGEGVDMQQSWDCYVEKVSRREAEGRTRERRRWMQLVNTETSWEAQREGAGGDGLGSSQYRNRRQGRGGGDR